MTASESESASPASPAAPRSRAGHAWWRWLVHAGLWLGGLVLAGVFALLFVVGLALAVAYPNLPEISSLTDYRPKLPLRVYSADGIQIGEFGEERRTFVPIARCV